MSYITLIIKVKSVIIQFTIIYKATIITIITTAIIFLTIIYI